MPGKLYLVATPIGNLDDMSVRAVETLKNVSIIACEDTRTSRKLLDHFDIHTPTTSYHEFNKYDKADFLVEKLLSGEDIAEITDAGTPGISDPGEVLVEKCYEAGIEVYSTPGPAAFVNALVSSGLPTRRVAFEAFLPQEKKEKERILSELQNETRTIVLYEAPHRLKKTLQDLATWLGPARRLTVCRELTKKFEEKVQTTLEGALHYYEENEPRGEYVLVIAGKAPEEIAAEKAASWADMSIADHVAYYENDKGLSHKEAMKAAATDRGVSKRDIYAALLAQNGDKSEED